jgi:outer membrane protein, heavy metal efflux system
VLLLLTTFGAFAADDPLATEGALSPERLVRATIAANAEMAVAEATVALAKARVQAAGRAPEPMVDLGVAPLSVVGHPLGWSIGIEQELPLWGMLRREREMVGAGVAVAEAERAAMALELAQMATMAWVDWWMMHRAIALMDETVHLMEASRDAALRRYGTGKGDTTDHLMLSAEVAMMLAEHHAMEGERDLVAARINLLLRRDTSTPLPPPPPRLPDPPVVREAQHPADAEAAAMAAMAEAGTAMARAEQLPMIGVMAGWDAMEEMVEHRLMVGVSVELPTSQKARRGAVDVAVAEEARAAAMRTMVQEALRRQAEEARIGTIQQERQLEVIRQEMLPAAWARVEAAKSGFSTGRLSSQPLIDAERGLREVRMREVEAEATWWMRSAEQAFAAGSAMVEGP